MRFCIITPSRDGLSVPTLRKNIQRTLDRAGVLWTWYVLMDRTPEAELRVQALESELHADITSGRLSLVLVDDPPLPQRAEGRLPRCHFGNPLRNEGIARAMASSSILEHSVLMFLDDDNLLHPQLPGVLSLFEDQPCLAGVLMDQQYRGGRIRLKPRDPSDPIDVNNFLVRASEIGDARFVVDPSAPVGEWYAADQSFFRSIHHHPDRWKRLDYCGSFYNALKEESGPAFQGGRPVSESVLGTTTGFALEDLLADTESSALPEHRFWAGADREAWSPYLLAQEMPGIVARPETGWCQEDDKQALLRACEITESRGGLNLYLELGSWGGSSCRFVLDHYRDAFAICIDSWRIDHQPGDVPWRDYLYETFVINMRDYRDRVLAVRRDTIIGINRVAKLSAKPEVIYIDAGHDFDNAFTDAMLCVWHWPEAILVIDDNFAEFPGVQRLVANFHETDPASPYVQEKIGDSVIMIPPYPAVEHPGRCRAGHS